MSNSKWRTTAPKRRYRDGELVAADLSAIWNAKERKPRHDFWPRVGTRYAVLPPVFIEDLMKHHAHEGASYLKEFLSAIGQVDRTLIGKWDFERSEMKLDGVSGLVPVPDWRADIAAVHQNNALMVAQYRETANGVLRLRTSLLNALSEDEVAALRAIRKRPLTNEQVGEAARAVGAWINTGGRRLPFEQMNPFDQAVELVMATAALRAIDELSTKDSSVQNDIFDLHYAALGLMVGDVITNDTCLRNTFVVANEVPKYLLPENILELVEHES